MSSVSKLSEKHENYDLSLNVTAPVSGKPGVTGTLTIFSMIEGKPIITRKVSGSSYQDSVEAAEEALISKLLERAGV